MSAPRASSERERAREQFADLVAQHQRRAVRIAYSYLRDAHDADEAVQDAFVKVFTHIASYREEYPFEVWFTRILVNGCLDLRKAREKAHVREGLAIALANIDAIIALIKAAKSPAEAKEQLMSNLWEPGVVIQMLERTGAEASRPEGLDPAFGLVEGRYRLSEAQAQAVFL